MKQLILILIVNMATMCYAQDSKQADENSLIIEGYYHLNEFEMAASLYLLNTGHFVYKAIFGSVDLYVYGNYSIFENKLKLNPYEEQKQPFVVYSRKNKALKDSVLIKYYKYNADYSPVFNISNQWVMTSESENEPLILKIPNKNLDKLQIGYPSYVLKDEGDLLQIRETLSTTTLSGDNEFIVSYNLYYSMKRSFSMNTMTLEGETLVFNDRKVEKEPLNEGEKESILDFIKKNIMYANTIYNNGKVYQKISCTSDYNDLEIKKKDYSIHDSFKE